jgi:hypothetical protein
MIEIKEAKKLRAAIITVIITEVAEVAITVSVLLTMNSTTNKSCQNLPKSIGQM